MSLQEQFDDAADRVQTLSERPDNDTMLELYGLFKQATEGDCTTKKPSRLKIRERAKHGAWEDKKGMAEDDAKQAYIDLVDRLVEEDGG